jgi:hypothetical protein
MRGPGHGRREAEQKARPPERKPGQWHGGRPQGGGSSGGGGGGFLARRSAGRGRS